MAMLIYDSAVIYDTPNYTYDGEYIGPPRSRFIPSLARPRRPLTTPPLRMPWAIRKGQFDDC